MKIRELAYYGNIWSQFVTASLMGGFNPEVAARKADEALKEYIARFGSKDNEEKAPN